MGYSGDRGGSRPHKKPKVVRRMKEVESFPDVMAKYLPEASLSVGGSAPYAPGSDSIPAYEVASYMTAAAGPATSVHGIDTVTCSQSTIGLGLGRGISSVRGSLHDSPSQRSYDSDREVLAQDGNIVRGKRRPGTTHRVEQPPIDHGNAPGYHDSGEAAVVESAEIKRASTTAVSGSANASRTTSKDESEMVNYPSMLPPDDGQPQYAALTEGYLSQQTCDPSSLFAELESFPAPYLQPSEQARGARCRQAVTNASKSLVGPQTPPHEAEYPQQLEVDTAEEDDAGPDIVSPDIHGYPHHRGR